MISLFCCGAEDVALLKYGHLTGRPFQVFSLGFIEDDHQECCRIRKVRSLKRALKVLRAWITGQRKDQSAGTRSEIPIVQIDPSFEGLDGGACSLVKLNPVANVDGKDIWNFLRAMNVPVNSLHSQGYVTIGYGGAAVSDNFDTKDIASLEAMEGSYIELVEKLANAAVKTANFRADDSLLAFVNALSGAENVALLRRDIVSLSRPGIENLLRLENRHEPWLLVLYAPWCRFCQAMEGSYVELAEKLASYGVKVAKNKDRW
ncbi:hypothetical protein T459_11319 [Capsicum annuum]|uniref:Thioredoxin domain-containing protein n=1 Tax=Capsicum annuum TaxID=4072 RepID=A0A2G2ZLK5_CAPAN|nr:hypothetical protein T459_11319 [Capsicum annuum]